MLLLCSLCEFLFFSDLPKIRFTPDLCLFSPHHVVRNWPQFAIVALNGLLYLRNRSALAVNCCVIIHCLEVSCKEGQITSTRANDLSSYN